MDSGVWQATVHVGCQELDITEQLTVSLFHIYIYMRLLHWQADSLSLSHLGSIYIYINTSYVQRENTTQPWKRMK